MQKIELLITITDRNLGKKYVDLFKKHGVSLILSTPAKGTATSDILDLLDIEACEKIVILAILTSNNVKPIIKDAKMELYIDIPGNGIMLTVSVDSVAGGRVYKSLTEGQCPAGELICSIEGECNMGCSEYDLIIIVSNEGYSDIVMDCAKDAGATGGTVIHAKGTGIESSEKFFGMTIASEKDMIMIVAKSGIKKEIMHAIMDDEKIQKKAEPIMFTLPVDDIAGLRHID